MINSTRSMAFSFALLLPFSNSLNAAQDLPSAVAELAAEITNRSAAEDQGSIALGVFLHRDNTCSDLTYLIYDELLYSLFNSVSDRFTIIERTQLQQLLAEQSLSESVFFQTGGHAETGLLENAGAIVIGTLSSYGDTLRINARLVNSSTGKVFSVARSEFPLTQSMQDLTTNKSRANCNFSTASGLNQEFPLAPEAIPSDAVSTLQFEGFSAELLSISVDENQRIQRIVFDVKNTSEEDKALTFWNQHQEWMLISDRTGNFLNFAGPTKTQFGLQGAKPCVTSALRNCANSTIMIPRGSLIRIAIDAKDNKIELTPPLLVRLHIGIGTLGEELTAHALDFRGITY